MQIPDVDKFEEKLREVEQQLGISPANGVPVVFERQKDSVWPSLAATLFIGFMLLNAVAAFKSMKNMNFFVSVPWSFAREKEYLTLFCRM